MVSNQRTVELRCSRNVLDVEPLPPELDASFRSGTHGATSDKIRGWQMNTRVESLLSDSSGNANGGLWDAVHYVAMGAGIDVQLIREEKRRVGRPRLDEFPLRSSQVSHLAHLIHHHPRGLIRHQLKLRDLAMVVAMLASAFPEARIGVVAASRNRARRLHYYLCKHIPGATLATSNSCRCPGSRIVVSTIFGLMHDEVCNHNPHLLLFLDAPEAVSERGQMALIGMEFARTFAFIDDRRWLPPRLSDLVIAAFGFEEAMLPQLGYQSRQVEVAWYRINTPCEPGPNQSPENVVRDLVWRDAIRNRLIGRLARGLADGTECPGQALAPTASGTAAAISTRTLVVTDSLEHALKLARGLNHWPVVIGPHVTLEGLGRADRRLLEERPREFDNRAAIATVAGLDSIPLDQVDIIVWAGAGPGPCPLPASRLICEAGRQHRLVLVDICDRHHPLLRSWASRRLAGYERMGWFPMGISPVVGRIKRFLAERPGYHRA